MDWHPVQGGVVILLVASCKETRIISSGLGQATAQTQTLPNYLQPLDLDDMNCCYYKLYELATQDVDFCLIISWSVGNIFHKS